MFHLASAQVAKVRVINPTKSENRHNKDFYVVKPQGGNIHGLIPQPSTKQFNMNERDTHSIQSTPSLTTRLSESPTLLSIQGVSYTSREQLPIQGSQAFRKISLLSYLDPKILVMLP